MRYYFRKYLDEEELEPFFIWAWGKNYKDIKTHLGFMKLWNALHENELRLSPTGSIHQDSQKMLKLWRESG